MERATEPVKQLNTQYLISLEPLYKWRDVVGAYKGNSLYHIMHSYGPTIDHTRGLKLFDGVRLFYAE
jgi:hypothetical protein